MKLTRTQALDVRGFTILEMLIAVTVFSTMLLLATSGIVHLGRIYYKGLITSKTQEVSRNIIAETSQTIQLVGNATRSADTDSGAINFDASTKAVCIGNVRFTYIDGPLSSRLRDGEAAHVLWVDKLLPGSACYDLDLTRSNPSDVSRGSDPSFPGREMMATNMRLREFSIIELSPSVYTIKVDVTFGDLDLFAGPGIDDSCVPINAGGRFCANSELQTIVKVRL